MNLSISELLAPAGSMEALYGAVENGADAVYLGGESFSARAGAANFNRQQLEEGLKYAHLNKVKIHVAMNTLVSDDEMEEALKYAAYLYEIGVDGLILQDMGLATNIRKLLPDFELHASTQMSVVDFEGAKFLEDMGFTRVVVAREMDLNEIKKIKNQTNLEVEAFGHGALCVSISGQCLMSSMIGGRSGNRGSCAQPCRKSYEIVKDDRVLKDRAYVISPKDLMTIDRLETLAEAGVDSLKLEGRLKRPEYVAEIVKNYRQALDGKTYDIGRINQAFNRNFTHGLPLGDFGQEFVTLDRPGNRGVVVGEVVKGFANNQLLEFTKPVHAGDRLEFKLQDGTTEIVDMDRDGANKFSFHYPKALKPGPIRRLQSAKQFEENRASYEDVSGKVGLDAYIKLAPGEHPILRLSGEKSIEVIGDQVVEVAKKAPLTEDRIFENLAKFDQSHFYLQSLEAEIEGPVFLPLSALNHLRREALEKYEDLYSRRRTPVEIRLPDLERHAGPEDTILTLEISEAKDIEKLNLTGIDRLETSISVDFNRLKPFIEDFQGELYLSLPVKVKLDEVEAILEEYPIFNGLIVQNLGQIQRFKDRYPLIIGEGLNIFNSYSFDYFSRRFRDVILSPECTQDQRQEIARRTGQVGEVVIYGYERVMTMVHCPMSLIKGCGSDRNCNLCNFRTGYQLRDEMSVDFPFRRIGDMTEIYNSVPTYLGNYINNILNLRPSALKIRVKVSEDIGALVDLTSQALAGNLRPLQQNGFFKNRKITRGHWDRGILG